MPLRVVSDHLDTPQTRPCPPLEPKRHVYMFRCAGWRLPLSLSTHSLKLAVSFVRLLLDTEDRQEHLCVQSAPRRGEEEGSPDQAGLAMTLSTDKRPEIAVNLSLPWTVCASIYTLTLFLLPEHVRRTVGSRTRCRVSLSEGRGTGASLFPAGAVENIVRKL